MRVGGLVPQSRTVSFDLEGELLPVMRVGRWVTRETLHYWFCGWGDYGAQAYEQSRSGAAGAGEANGRSDIIDVVTYDLKEERFAQLHRSVTRIVQPGCDGTSLQVDVNYQLAYMYDRSFNWSNVFH